ncbi:uncharacterized protein LAESUDRAFT_765291 [Laetiporus sulphureus 93-53]|uniref:Uncharacterized protein n=1 Tax=Laetiporus sulphureus 93-53 TaxID=1314785 RepID=A0A165AU40_9APHY|nr:uncharacterized protein LAESUDRAFT_765291 [Laetiporus sulphureus 93-53]KZS99666.1 hypothetical protein LAESUDRAFT_765291 [Laetiporus sulphureus 93-53]
MNFTHGDMHGERQARALSWCPLETRPASDPAFVVPALASTHSHLLISSPALAPHGLVLASTPDVRAHCRSVLQAGHWSRCTVEDCIRISHPMEVDGEPLTECSLVAVSEIGHWKGEPVHWDQVELRPASVSTEVITRVHKVSAQQWEVRRAMFWSKLALLAEESFPPRVDR